MNKLYFGFGIADSMFNGNVTVERTELAPMVARSLIETAAKEERLQPCLNPSHAETIRVMRERYGIEVPIPTKAPVVGLSIGDSLLVMAVSGLPRLEGRHEYTKEEVDSAKFRFALWTVKQ